jgi:hypothetical protein
VRKVVRLCSTLAMPVTSPAIAMVAAQLRGGERPAGRRTRALARAADTPPRAGCANTASSCCAPTLAARLLSRPRAARVARARGTWWRRCCARSRRVRRSDVGVAARQPAARLGTTRGQAQARGRAE